MPSACNLAAGATVNTAANMAVATANSSALSTVTTMAGAARRGVECDSEVMSSEEVNKTMASITAFARDGGGGDGDNDGDNNGDNNRARELLS